MNWAAMIYLELVLISTVNSMQIIASVILSVFVLGEKFIVKWDLPALLLIILGSAGMIFCSDKE